MLFAIGAIVILGGGLALLLIGDDNEAADTVQSNQQTSTAQDESLDALMVGAPADSAEVEIEQTVYDSIEYQIRGTLEDVTDGQVRTINTNGNSTGTAEAAFVEDTYVLNVDMDGLPVPSEGEFYEGWIVRKSPFKFISTGELEQQTDGSWTNQFMAEEDLTDFTEYVLTIEPDDNDPAPDAHVLEGSMASIN